MSNKTIKIKGEPYRVGFSFLGARYFEEMTGLTIDKCIGTWNHLIYFYCVLKALNKKFTYSFDEFNEILDGEPDLLIQFIQTSPEPGEPTAKKKMSINQGLRLWMLLPFAAALPVLIPVISIISWVLMSFWLFIKFIKKAGKKRGSRF